MRKFIKKIFSFFCKREKVIKNQQNKVIVVAVDIPEPMMKLLYLDFLESQKAISIENEDYLLAASYRDKIAEFKAKNQL